MRHLLLLTFFLSACVAKHSDPSAVTCYSVLPDPMYTYGCSDYMTDIAYRLAGIIPFYEGEQEKIDYSYWCDDGEIEQICAEACVENPNWLPCSHQCTS